jgi:1-acyl-sn-glycerol-3-phosphate acyltransferase
MLEPVFSALITSGTRFLTGAQCRWLGCGPEDTQRIYFANHSSHVDFVRLWATLPRALRTKTRPVAAADYWDRGPIRRYFLRRVFHGVLVERSVARARSANPLGNMLEALDAGDSLILFPEGTRGTGERLLPFKSGIYHLAQVRPTVELVPVWMDNNYRVMPKGTIFPIPLLCSVTFGQPTRLGEGEDRHAFLTRLSQSLEELGCA